MKQCFFALLFVVVGCQALPLIYNTAEKVLTDEAVKVEVYKDCIPKGDTLEADIKIVPPESK